MNKYSLRRQMEPASRLKYLWLVLGTICSLFSFNGRWDIALAAWLAPFFLLRFMRTSRTRIGLTGVWLATALAMLFSFYSLQLLTPLLIVVGLLFSTVLTLPYLLDRLVAPRLSLVSGLLATLLFPLSRVAGEHLISFTPAVGSVFSLAYTQYGNLPLLQISSLSTNQPFTPADLVQLRSAFVPLDNELLNLSLREARAGAKIIVWPEIGAYILATDKTSLLERGQTLAREARVYLDMGMAVFQPPATYYNQAVLVDPQGHVDWTYNKAYPAPGDLSKPGNAVVPFVETPYGLLANVICFDADFTDLMRQAGSKGVDIVLVPSNDWQEIDPWHTQHAIFRAIENGYSLVRPTSNGLAMTVDYEGNVLAATDYFTTQQTMIASVPVKGTWTMYAHVGDLFAWLCLAGWLFLAGFVAFTAFQKRRR